jgi:hypothetical protein
MRVEKRDLEVTRHDDVTQLTDEELIDKLVETWIMQAVAFGLDPESCTLMQFIEAYEGYHSSVIERLADPPEPNTGARWR